jgi:hypothetical protein
MAKRNALEGAASTYEVLADGRVVTHPDATNPAVLSDADIINALQMSRQARNDFRLVFPTLSATAQARLTNLLESNPRISNLIYDNQKFTDMVQQKDIRGPVRTCGPRGGKGYGGRR